MIRFVVAALMFLTAGAPQSPQLPEMLQSFIGEAWTASGEFPGMGPYSAERRYEWVHEGKFIRMRQQIKVGNFQSVVEGIIGWDPGKKRVTAWGFSDDGSLVVTACECRERDVIVFEGELFGGMQPGPVRGTFRRLTENRFNEVVEVKRDGEWRKQFEFAFTRGPAVPAGARRSSVGSPERRVGGSVVADAQQGLVFLCGLVQAAG